MFKFFQTQKFTVILLVSGILLIIFGYFKIEDIKKYQYYLKGISLALLR